MGSTGDMFLENQATGQSSLACPTLALVCQAPHHTVQKSSLEAQLVGAPRALRVRFQLCTGQSMKSRPQEDTTCPSHTFLNITGPFFKRKTPAGSSLGSLALGIWKELGTCLSLMRDRGGGRGS